MIAKIQLFIFLFIMMPLASAVTSPSGSFDEEGDEPFDVIGLINGVIQEPEWNRLTNEYIFPASEKEFIFSTVSVSTPSNACVGFFINPNTIVTSYYAVGDVVHSSIDDIRIMDYFGVIKRVSRILYIDSYHDLVVIKLSDYSSDYFLNLSEKEGAPTSQDELILPGYFLQFKEDGSSVRYPLGFKGKIITDEEDYYAVNVNFYKVNGLCGAPVLDKKTGKVRGRFSTVIGNYTIVQPIKELLRVIREQDFCESTNTCLSQAHSSLDDRIEKNQAFAQFMSGNLSYADFQHFLNKDDIESAKFFLQQALNYFWLAGQQGHSISLHNLYNLAIGIYCDYGYFKNQKTGFEDKATCDSLFKDLHEFAHKTDYYPAVYYLGLLYMDLQKDEEKAENYFTQAAENGFAFAEITLAEMYFQRFVNLGGEANRLKALLWTERANKNGWFQSQKRILFLKSKAVY